MQFNENKSQYSRAQILLRSWWAQRDVPTLQISLVLLGTVGWAKDHRAHRNGRPLSPDCSSDSG
jgi:hypothetical protein